MFTLLLRLFVLIWISFASLAMLFRTQPYRSLITEGLPGSQPDCASPCFLGIQVGRTTPIEALALLSRHPWIERAERATNQFIIWNWSGRQPDYINPAIPGKLMINADRIIAISLWTNYQLGDWILTLGSPAVMESGSTVQDGKLGLFYNIGFTEPSIYLSGMPVGACAKADVFWRQPVGMEIRPVYPPWNDSTQSQTLHTFIERFQRLRERNCRR
ncbi:MAG: hypothetical protein J0M33_19930 [Anaerolineae bacterium]|nr:hypothetical protein [Anaerolineae bacterium]